MSHHVGDRIVNEYGPGPGHPNHGKTGVISAVYGNTVHVRYDDGETGQCPEGGHHYRNLSRKDRGACVVDEVAPYNWDFQSATNDLLKYYYGSFNKPDKKITIMQKLSNFITKTVDADTQALLKAGYINGNLEPTEKAFDKIDEINFFANKAALVEAAKADIADAEKKAEKSNG